MAFCETCNQSAETFSAIAHVARSHTAAELRETDRMRPLLERAYPELQTAELRAMTDRAYWRAAREWSEYRAFRRDIGRNAGTSSLELAATLRDVAQTSSDLYSSFAAELARRDAAETAAYLADLAETETEVSR
jgi:hypothetical protein